MVGVDQIVAFEIDIPGKAEVEQHGRYPQASQLPQVSHAISQLVVALYT